MHITFSRLQGRINNPARLGTRTYAKRTGPEIRKKLDSDIVGKKIPNFDLVYDCEKKTKLSQCCIETIGNKDNISRENKLFQDCMETIENKDNVILNPEIVKKVSCAARKWIYKCI